MNFRWTRSSPLLFSREEPTGAANGTGKMGAFDQRLGATSATR
ncbi:MAG: hypothetical protein U1E83_06420 [Methylotetracoccus sp.]